jgi:release factor glutamine methyltransferase
MTRTAADWLASAEDLFKSKGVPEPAANAEFIMAAALKCGRAEVLLHANRALTVKQGNSFWHLAERRARRLPLAYVLGSQPFMGLDIEVDEGALVPRPETEELVAEAARLLQSRAQEPLHFLEIGTGTGCISVALAKLFPRATIYATEISAEAFKLAQKNAERHHKGLQIRFIREDLFKPDAGRQSWADLVISNPPYIPTKEIDRLEPEVLKEPRMALDGGRDGLSALRAIIADAPRYLKPGGLLALEMGSAQGAAVTALMEKAGFSRIAIKKDAQGHDRIAIGFLSKMVD